MLNMWSLLFVLLLSADGVCADLKIYTEDLPPVNYLHEGRLVGVSVDIVQEIQKRINDKTAIQVMPWARAYNEALSQNPVMLFATNRIPERESLFKWVGPIAMKEWIFVKLKKNKFVIRSLEDAKKVKSIGSYISDSKVAFLQREGFKNISLTNKDEQNALKLSKNHLDLWITGREDLEIQLKKLNLNPNDFEVAMPLHKNILFIAFSKLTPDSVVSRWQTALIQMKTDGTFDKIHLKNKSLNPNLNGSN